MALKLKCACGERLSAPESAAGKRGKCPKCGMKFIVPGPQVATTATGPSTPPARTAAPDNDFGLDLPDLGGKSGGSGLDDLFDEAFDEPLGGASPLASSNPYASPQTMATPAKRRVSSREGLNRLGSAIKLVFWGTVGTVASMIAAMFLGILSAVVGELGAALAMVLLIAMVGFTLLAVVGRVLCLLAPAKVGGKPLVVIAVACDLSALVLNVLVAMKVAHPVFLLLAYVFGLATFIFFVLYLRAVARSVGESSLADDAGTVMVTVGVCIGSIFLAALFPLAGLITIGALLYGVYKYLNLLQFMGEQLRR